jgi:hypothetical protein
VGYFIYTAASAACKPVSAVNINTPTIVVVNVVDDDVGVFGVALMLLVMYVEFVVVVVQVVVVPFI